MLLIRHREAPAGRVLELDSGVARGCAPRSELRLSTVSLSTVDLGAEAPYYAAAALSVADV
jgi:hypothetical protein